MSIICGAIKNGRIAIACDTQVSYGSMKINAKYLKQPGKFFSINGSIIGVVGYAAMHDVLAHLAANEREMFKLNSRQSIFETFLHIHEKLKDTYFVQAKDGMEGQPLESNHITALIVNKHGLFEAGTYREVTEASTFWAVGSGRRYALGAMHALYDSPSTSAKKIVEAGVRAAADFDDACSLPLMSTSLKMESSSTA